MPASISILLLLASISPSVFSTVFELPSWQSNTSLVTANNAAAIPALVSNISAPPLMDITCDARKYGQNLRVPSCKKVITLISTNDTDITFADRSSALQYDVALPYRIQSGQDQAVQKVIYWDKNTNGVFYQLMAFATFKSSLSMMQRLELSAPPDLVLRRPRWFSSVS